jgi:hypothetical protein
MKQEEFVAEQAALCKKLDPEEVIGSWITHVYRKRHHELGGNAYRIDDEKIISNAKTYIHVGSKATHGKKIILKRPHEEFSPTWLYGRGRPGDNVIYVWKNL